MALSGKKAPIDEGLMPPMASTEGCHTGTGLSKNVTKLKRGVQRDHGQVIHALDDLKRNPGSRDMKNGVFGTPMVLVVPSSPMRP